MGLAKLAPLLLVGWCALPQAQEETQPDPMGQKTPVVILQPVEWDIQGDVVWPQERILPPAAILKLALSAHGFVPRVAPSQRTGCFSEGCAHAEARETRSAKALVTALIRLDTVLIAKIALYDTVTREVRAVRASWTDKTHSPRIEIIRDAVQRLLEGSGDVEAGKFSEIPWLRARPDPTHLPLARWALSTVAAGALLTVWLEGQLAEDRVTGLPSHPLLPPGETRSFLPGMFSGFAPSTAQAARGHAGMAKATGAEAGLVSPAGIATILHPELLLVRSSLPDGTPEFQAAFAAPAAHGFAQGYHLRYRGDGLSDEAVFGVSGAVDFGWFHTYFIGMQAGATLKLFLGEVGRGGVGEERSRGHSFGTGLDLGFRARLMRGVMAAATLEDAASILRHRNDFTNASETEVRPPRLSLGVSLQPSETIGLMVDGRKGLYADQGDMVAVGLERSVMQVIRLRAGIQEIFGRETVRKIATGFGLRNDGFEDRFGGRRLAVDYAFEYGLDDAGILAGGHRFGMLASF
jgi:hypothetical protein